MGDAQLQTLRRTWESSRALEDEVAYLREAQRAGVLSNQRLTLAAHCGSLAAVRCLELRPEALIRDALMTHLSELDRETESRLCAAIGRATLEALAQLRSEVGPRFDTSLLEASCSALEAWLVDPGPAQRKRVEHVAEASQVNDLRPIRRSPHTAWMITQPVFSPVANSAAMLMLHASGVLARETNDPQTFPLIRPVLLREVVPWLLGYADPVRVRVRV